MSSSKNRGRRPPSAKGTFAQPDKPPDYNNETPKFCLRFLRAGFDVHALDTAGAGGVRADTPEARVIELEGSHHGTTARPGQ